MRRSGARRAGKGKGAAGRGRGEEKKLHPRPPPPATPRPLLPAASADSAACCPSFVGLVAPRGPGTPGRRPSSLGALPGVPVLYLRRFERPVRMHRQRDRAEPQEHVFTGKYPWSIAWDNLLRHCLSPLQTPPLPRSALAHVSFLPPVCALSCSTATPLPRGPPSRPLLIGHRLFPARALFHARRVFRVGPLPPPHMRREALRGHCSPHRGAPRPCALLHALYGQPPAYAPPPQPRRVALPLLLQRTASSSSRPRRPKRAHVGPPRAPRPRACRQPLAAP